MIEFPSTIDNKPEWQRDERSPVIIDFLPKDYTNPPNKGSLIGIDLFLVGKNEAMRPDLITQQMYGYLSPIEKVLKFNAVSNPFAIDEGQVFTVWDLNSAENFIRPQKTNAEEREDIRKQYMTPEKKSTVDPRLRDFDKR
ncbi:MAG: hypothetical protein RLZZ479_742, partial [Bacteroidota bacterium]